jgi:hypothetical protein
MTLQEVFDSLVMKTKFSPVPVPGIKSSRIPGIKSSIKQYAVCLGYDDPSFCPEEKFNLPAEQRNSLIEERAHRLTKSRRGANGLGKRTVRNTKQNITLLLKEAINNGLIPRREIKRPDESDAEFARHRYTPGFKELKRSNTKWLPKYVLPEKDLPPRLRKEMDAYYEWATAEFNPDRPRTRKRRPITATHDRDLLRRIAGFMITRQGVDPKSLTLKSLTAPDVARGYASWFIEHHEHVTLTLVFILVAVKSLADYLAIIARTTKEREKMRAASSAMEYIKERLPNYVTVREKHKYWLSLEQIEQCGINRYPRNQARLLKSSSYVRRGLETLDKKKAHSTFKYTAVHAFQSLLLRFLVRIPLRARNLVEMCWNPHRPEHGKNLYREDGVWYVRFTGAELKIENRRGKIHSIKHKIPADLTWLLEEVLTVWRPLITEVPYRFPVADEGDTWNYREHPQTRAPKFKKAPDNVLLFLTASGKPADRHTIRQWVETATYAYTKVAVNPHLIRDIWATTYIKKTGDLIGAAKRLGDLIETILRDYAHLLDEEAEERADAFNDSIFNLSKSS